MSARLTALYGLMAATNTIVRRMGRWENSARIIIAIDLAIKSVLNTRVTPIRAIRRLRKLIIAVRRRGRDVFVQACQESASTQNAIERVIPAHL